MATKTRSPESGELTIEQLQQKYQALNTRRIEADANLKNAKKQLNQLKQEARDKYGTDDLAALRTRLDDMRNENEAKRRAYQAELERIQTALDAVEQQFRSVSEADGEPV